MKKVLFILLGTIFAALALNIFLLPSKIAPGGISGVASIINNLSGGLFPVGVTVLVLNIPLFFAGYKYLGKTFALKSLTGTVLYSVMIDVTKPIADIIVLGLHAAEPGVSLDLLFSVWGGVFLGIGLGLIFKAGATTGGTDIAARLLKRRMAWLTLGQLVLFFDVVLLVVIAVAYKSILPALYSGITVFIASKVIDVVEAGVNYAKAVYIITTKPKEIADEIMRKLERGVTSIKGSGMYTGKEMSVLLCVVYNRQLPTVNAIASLIDPTAFVMVSDVREASGLWSHKAKASANLHRK